MKQPSNFRPPKWAITFLKWFCREDLFDAVLGDLEELHSRRLEKYGKRRANWMFIGSLFLFFRPFAFKKTSIPQSSNHLTMFQHYFKISWRNLARNKAFTFLNISGLAIGMACTILILLWVNNELSYDRFHPDSDRIYRINAVAGNGEFKAAICPPAMAQGLEEKMPEIDATVRLGRFDLRTAMFEVGDQQYIEDDIFYADSNFLDFFQFPLVAGDKATALYTPNGILLTERTAHKYFGTTDVLGKTIVKDSKDVCIVTGILKDLPSNSHIQFSLLMPMSILAKTHEDLINNVWDNFGFYTFLKFQPGTITSKARQTATEQKIDQIFQERTEQMEIVFNLQELTDIHLYSDQQFDVPGHGNSQYVNIFFIVAIFILSVACINFMNLATAKSVRRAKEVGLRKVVGAKRGQLVGQFLSESMIISFLSLLIAVVLVYTLLPAFNNLAGKELVFDLGGPQIWIGLFGIALLTGLLSGSYPALFLSSFQPVKVFRGKMDLGSGNKWFRNGLVITQFIVSLVLLIGTTVVYTQLNYMKNRNLGFDKSNLLYFPITGDLESKRTSFEDALAANPLTQEFSVVSELPSYLTSGALDLEWEGKDPDLNVVIPNMFVDERFEDVFQVEMIRGRSFSKEYSTDGLGFLVNETAVDLMSMTLDDAVGKPISFQGRDGKIIGVVKDFNFKPLQYSIEPLVLQWNNFPGGFAYGYAAVRVGANQVEETISALEEIHGELNPSFPLAYHFFDQDLDNMYQGEKQMGAIFNLFALLAIFISCLGLYGLSAYMAEQRTKEIGIRKVLGASMPRLVSLLSQDFIKLVLASFFVAIPLSWYLMTEWLKEFAYRIELSWWIFAVSIIAILLITFMTVSYQVIRTAMKNPVSSLRSE